MNQLEQEPSTYRLFPQSMPVARFIENVVAYYTQEFIAVDVGQELRPFKFGAGFPSRL